MSPLAGSPAPLPTTDFLNLRLTSLGHVVAPAGLDAPGVRATNEVTRMLALQGQDLPGALWSLGIRERGLTLSQVSELFNDGRLIRTWPFRGTLHVMTPASAHTVLGLMGPRTLTATTKRRTELGLDEGTVDRARTLLAAALASRGALSRAEAGQVWEDGGIAITNARLYHLILTMCLLQDAWWGPLRGKEQLLVAPTPGPPPEDPGEVSKKIVSAVVAGRGPISVADIAGWSTLGKREVMAALDELGDSIAWIRHVGSDQDFVIAAGLEPAAPRRTLLCPGFDEFLLGYKTRTPQLAEGDMDRVVPGGNGVFRATIVHGGKVVGTWSRKDLAAKSVVTLDFFTDAFANRPPSATLMTALAREAKDYGRFLERPVELQVR